MPPESNCPVNRPSFARPCVGRNLLVVVYYLSLGGGDCSSGAMSAADRLMSPAAAKGSKIAPSPMRKRTAAAASAMGNEGELAVSFFLL